MIFTTQISIIITVLQYIIMFSYLSDTNIVTKLALRIIQPKQAYYNEDPIYLTLSYMTHIVHVDAAVFNKYDERLKVSLFYDKTVSEREVCVIFMHGYGSNRVQAVSILPHLPKEYSLCCFDFSAQGKSDGDIVTFGHKQKYDVRAIVNYLKTCGYKKFVLWGRSMGATCTLLFTQKQKPQGVFLQILDSPFVSFEQAALQLTKKRAKIPQVIIKMALEAVKEHICRKSEQFNPFQVNLNKNIIKSNIPTIFIYSEEDDIVNPENSHRIINNFQGHYEKLLIQEHHNSIRYPKTLKQIVSLIKKYYIKNQRPERPINNNLIKDERKSKTKINTVRNNGQGMSMSVGSDYMNTCSSPHKSLYEKLHVSIKTDRMQRKDRVMQNTPTHKKVNRNIYDFDHYGFVEQNQKPKPLVRHPRDRKDKVKTKDFKQFIAMDGERKRPKSSIKVYSANISKDTIANITSSPINLRGSHALKSSSSMNKTNFTKEKLSNDFYL